MTAQPGEFIRQPYIFRDRITSDGSSGYPAVAGRYHVYVSPACPWAQRALIVRHLLGLQDAITVSVVDPIRDERGWSFREPFVDEVNGFSFLREAYEATDPNYDLNWTVPVLWDRETRRIVSNAFDEITIMLETEFPHSGPNLYPEEMREEIDAINRKVYEDVNNGFYRCGFAGTQTAYDQALDALFGRLDEIESRLSSRRYLLGEHMTEADIRLFTTLARFDVVYHYHFKCNLRRLVDYPNIWAYSRDLYQQEAFHSTTNFDHIRRHYYMTHPELNPRRIVPGGPILNWWEPHGRGNGKAF